MRAVIAALVVGVALLAVPYAPASLFPPAGQLRLEKVKMPKRAPFTFVTKTCAAHSKGQSILAEISRKVQPVACEQPPRSNALDGSFVITFAP